MTPRALHACLLLGGCASAAFGCQLVSGASSLDIVEDAGLMARDGAGVDGSTDGASTDARDAGSKDGDVADTGFDAPFAKCVMPEGGTYTTCRLGGVEGAASCIEFCAMQRKCCAEDCQPFSTDKSIHDAEFVGDTPTACIDPLSGGGTMGYTSCSNSPIPGADRTFKCCCR